MKNKIVILNSPKYSMEERTLFFTGAISDVIFNKELFQSNIDLKEYIKLFEETLNVDSYRDYLYLARPQLFARLIRDLFYPRKKRSIEEQQKITKIAIKKHIEFIEHKGIIDHKKEIKKYNSTLLSDVITSRKSWDN